jgi:hypothetical protein
MLTLLREENMHLQFQTPRFSTLLLLLLTISAPMCLAQRVEPQPEQSRPPVRTDSLVQQYTLQNQQPHATPDATEKSELLKNSKDPEFILRNFRTLYVDAREAQYFGSDQMKAALGRNPEFAKLKIWIVDDPRVADVVLSVSYTFAWDFPFQLRHQNTTTVLIAGKGEGPFSGPLGAADVARQFVNKVKTYREPEKAK